MMNLRINFDNLARQMLPPHKRLPGLLRFTRALFSPLASLFAGFAVWRDEVRIAINMTPEAGVLEGYLKAKYNEARIRVETRSDRGLAVGLHFEGRENAVRIGMRGEGSAAVVPLPGETAIAFADADFIVVVPATLDEATIERIRIDVERYKMVLMQYKIVKR